MGTNIGAVIAIATGTPSAEDASAFGALSYVTVEGTLSIPPIGDTAAPSKSTLLKTGRVKNEKGERTLGDLTISFKELATDAGMDAVRAAYLTDVDYSFRVTYRNGRIKYFYGMVNDLQENEATASTEEGGSFVILTNSGQVTVEPA
jgi:hypothetical protein